MNEPQTEPLSPSLQALLDAERAAPVPDVARQRVRARLDASLGREPDADARFAAPVEPPTFPGDRGWRCRPPAVAALAAAAAVLLGIAGWSLLRPLPAPQLLPMPATAASTAPAAENTANERYSLEIAANERTAVPPPRNEPAPDARAEREPAGRDVEGVAEPPTVPTDRRIETPGPGDLESERALLDRARSALTRNALQEALRAIGEHKRRFVTGLLTEDRAALEVRVLSAAGYSERARAAARAFLSRYPASIHRATVAPFAEDR